MPGVLARAGRMLRPAGIVLLFVTLAGATYQGVATALERREFTRPGGLVEVGDHQLHLYCTGTGSPTVVLEAPAAGLSAAWGEVQPRLAEVTRVCSYDRAGLGWSEAGDQPFDPGRVPEELRTLLTGARERGPFVVAGHGLGATFAQLYAARPDSEAAALVLIAPPRDAGATAGWLIPAAPWLARAGVLRAGRILSTKAEGLDGTAGGAVRAFLNRPDHLTRAAAELAKWDAAVQMAAGTAVAGNLPTVAVEVATRDRIAFLTERADVDQAVSALEAMVRMSRESSAAP